jgi:hypothetical protein
MFDGHVIGGDVELKSCSVEGIEVFLSRLSAVGGLLTPPADWAATLTRAWRRVLEHLSDKNFMAARIKAVDAIRTFQGVMQEYKKSSAASEDYKKVAKKVTEDLNVVLQEEKAPMVLQVLTPAAEKIIGELRKL